MTRICFIDTETYSPVSLSDGTGAYVEDVESMLVSFCFEQGDAFVWDRTASGVCPDELADGLEDPDCILYAHNSFFDRSALNATELPCFFDLGVRRWRCTMAQAFSHGLPGKLEHLGEILGLSEDQRKLKDGKQLVQLFCKPRPANHKLDRATRYTHPTEWARFVEYSRLDAIALREIHRRLPTWNYPDNERELELWFLDQTINDRGIMIDREMCEAAIRATGKAKHELNNETHKLTAGDVERATQRDQLLMHILLEHGVDLPNMQADTLERRMGDPELPGIVRELLGVRLESSMTSQTKYRKALRAASKDGRVRGLLQFAGAQRTARWAGRVLQPQNFIRPVWKQPAIDSFIRALKANVADLV